MTEGQPSEGARYRLDDVLWEPDAAGFGPRRARAPTRIQAYVPARLDAQRWRFSSAVSAALGDAQAEIMTARATPTGSA
jgi:hypothetical protein